MSSVPDTVPQVQAEGTLDVSPTRS